MRRGDDRFFKSVMKISRAKRQINYVGDSRDQECTAFFEKPSRDGIIIGLFIGAVE